MTLDVHHPSPADVPPLGEGLGARRCRQRASERDKSQRFHDDVFRGCSPFAFDSPARRLVISKITPSHFLLGEAQKVLMQINCEAADPDGSVAVPLSASGQKRALLRLSGKSAVAPGTDITRWARHVRFVPGPDSCVASNLMTIRALHRRERAPLVAS